MALRVIASSALAGREREREGSNFVTLLLVRLNPIELGRSRSVAIVAGCSLAFYVAYHLARLRLSVVWPPALRGDASIMFEQARSIFEHAAYPSGAVFPYSPSAVLIFRGLSVGGPSIFMALWYLLMVIGLVLTIRASLVQEHSNVRAAWPLLGGLAILMADSPISWDLRNANSNLIHVGLVMAGYGLLSAIPALAGALVGLSISLKPYSGLLLLWLAINGPRRAFFASVISVIILWFALPAVLFGQEGVPRVYWDWWQQLRTISDSTLHASLARSDSGPPLVTLQRAVVNSTGEEFGSAVTLVILSALWSIWVAALLWYAWRCRNVLPVQAPSRAGLADWIVLLLAPLPFSPWLEPYHAIPLFVGAVLCVTLLFDETLSGRDRLAALTATATLLLFIVLKVPFAVRGFGLGAQFLVFVFVLAYLRPRLDGRQTSM
jgi:hypothetical protein